jgi:hypothetical protein
MGAKDNARPFILNRRDEMSEKEANDCHPEAGEGAEPKATTPERPEGSQNSQFQPEPM